MSNAKFKRGDKVKLTQSWAKWMLEESHECFQCPKTGKIPANSKYDKLMQLAMLVMLEAPPIGTVLGKPLDYKVDFGSYGEEICGETDLYLANQVEVEINLPPDQVELLNRIAKKACVTPEQVCSVLITLKSMDLIDINKL